MAYNIDFDFAGIIFCLLGMACIYIRPSLKGRQRIWTYMFLHSIMTYDLLDVISYFMGEHHFNFSWIAGYMVYILYYTMIIVIPFIFLCYIVYTVDKSRKIYAFTAIPMLVVEAVLIFFNYSGKIIFSFNSSWEFTLNSGSFILYINWAVYILMIMVFIYRHRIFLGKLRIYTLMVMFSMALLISVLQLLIPQTLIVGFSLSVAANMLILEFNFIDDITDPVTGAHNKRGFFRATEEMLKYNRKKEFIIVRVDVYNFSVVNERFGYEIGDLFLKGLADDIKYTCRNACATAGYLGNDDFVYCIEKKKFINRPLSENLMSMINVQEPDKYNYELMFSVGIYEIKDKKLEVSAMLERAEYALSTVRGNYSRHMAYFEGKLEEQYNNKRYVEHKMNEALEKDQFEVYLQPIYDAKSGEIISAEALVRWMDPEIGIVYPDLFVPIFEKNGFITEVDERIWQKVIMLIKKWMENKMPVVPVSINISRADLDMEDIVQVITGYAKEYGVPAKYIKIEVTESAFTENQERMFETISHFRSKGYRVLMDDFGSGYSNFNMFRNIQIDIIKIDMKFLYGTEFTERGKLIIKSIVDMANGLGIGTVAEGVESEEQYRFLKENGCESIQGFYYSKPVSAEAFEELLKENREKTL